MKIAAYQPRSSDELERPYVVYFDFKTIRQDRGWTQVIDRWHIWRPHRGRGHTPSLYCNWFTHSDGDTRKHIAADVDWCERCKANFLLAVYKYYLQQKST